MACPFSKTTVEDSPPSIQGCDFPSPELFLCCLLCCKVCVFYIRPLSGLNGRQFSSSGLWGRARQRPKWSFRKVHAPLKSWRTQSRWFLFSPSSLSAFHGVPHCSACRETQIAGGPIADKQKIFKIYLNSTLFLLASDVPTPLDLVRKIRWAKVLGQLSYLACTASSSLHSWKSPWKFWKPSHFSKRKCSCSSFRTYFSQFLFNFCFPHSSSVPSQTPTQGSLASSH